MATTDGRGMFLRDVWTITAKDLHSELRTKEAWNASIAFSVVILLLFSFAFDPSSEQIQEFSGGLLWMTYAFAGALVLNRSFARELQNDCLDALIASPVSSAALFVGKALANFALLFAVELVSLPVFVLFYNAPWAASMIGPMLLVLAMGTWALTMIGTLFSALTVNLRLRELMLPTLVYPMMIPALIAAITVTTNVLAGNPPGLGIRLLAAFDIIFTLLAVVFVDTVLVG
jgi:heme exporter protein B